MELRNNRRRLLKVAILTALHLAQEYHELQRNCDQKTSEWSNALEQVLKR